MEKTYQVVRCPRCNSVDLSAHYKASKDETGRWKVAFWAGLVGVIYHFFRGEKKGNAYWECNRCGYVFPDETI